MNQPELVMGDAGMVYDGIRGIKLSTLREYKPGKYEGIEKGQEFDVICQDERVRSLCLASYKGNKVTEYENPLLMLDGYENPHVAALDMAAGYYKNFTEESPSALFVYAANSLLKSIFKDQKQIDNLKGKDIGETIRQPENAELFYPSWAYWFYSKMMGLGIDDWHEWLAENNLLDSKQKDFIIEWKKSHTREYTMLEKSAVKAADMIDKFCTEGRYLTPTFERAFLLRKPTKIK